MNQGRRNEKSYESNRYPQRHPQRHPDLRSLRYGELNRAWGADRYESNPFGEEFESEDFEDFGFEPHRERYDRGYGRHAAPDDGRGYHQPEEENHSGKGPRGYKRADARIYEEVCESLYHHSGVDAREIEVSVEDGIVTLSGSVEDRRMKRVAENCAERISGVHDVRNRLHTNYFGRDSNAGNSY